MQATNEQDRRICDFAAHYMEKLFYFCLKKTGKQVEAEDLTQDIALQIITALNKGTQPADFPAWVWRIARNRYAAWAGDKHERGEAVSGDDIGDHELADESGDLAAAMIRAEQLALLRRELAFIKSDYRHIVVAYYFENRNVREIAASLSLSVNTVKSRLLRARQILKEGMDMAREFGKRSYRPEQVAFVMNGRDGKHGQPWSIITHLLYKNIFLETYENPQTAEELSLELGIALPYMEDELAFLVREQLLTQQDNKYQTAFPIVSREEQRRKHEHNRGLQKPLTDSLCALIDTYMSQDGAKVRVDHIGYEAAKWALLVRTYDWMQWDAREERKAAEYSFRYPDRPDDGAWNLTGYETIDWDKPDFVGQHGYLSHDPGEVKQEIEFGQFKFFYRDLHDRTPIHLSWKEAYTLWLVCHGRTEACERAYLDKMLEYGYLRRDGASITPCVVVFDRSAQSACDEQQRETLAALRREIRALFDQAPDMERGYVVEQAIADGWLTCDDDSIPTLGAYIYL